MLFSVRRRMLGGIAVGFSWLLVAVSSPFDVIAAPADGSGLNPSLQNPYMVVHPVALYLGYVGLAVPFAFAMGALLSGRTDERWIVATRRWTIVAWTALGIGQLLDRLVQPDDRLVDLPLFIRLAKQLIAQDGGGERRKREGQRADLRVERVVGDADEIEPPDERAADAQRNDQQMAAADVLELPALVGWQPSRVAIGTQIDCERLYRKARAHVFGDDRVRAEQTADRQWCGSTGRNDDEVRAILRKAANQPDVAAQRQAGGNGDLVENLLVRQVGRDGGGDAVDRVVHRQRVSGQIVGTTKTHFSDHEVVAEAIKG